MTTLTPQGILASSQISSSLSNSSDLNVENLRLRLLTNASQKLRLLTDKCVLAGVSDAATFWALKDNTKKFAATVNNGTPRASRQKVNLEALLVDKSECDFQQVTTTHLVRSETGTALTRDCGDLMTCAAPFPISFVSALQYFWLILNESLVTSRSRGAVDCWAAE